MFQSYAFSGNFKWLDMMLYLDPFEARIWEDTHFGIQCWTSHEEGRYMDVLHGMEQPIDNGDWLMIQEWDAKFQ